MIIGIHGKKQSGKNTVATIWQLLDEYHTLKNRHGIYLHYENDVDFVSLALNQKLPADVGTEWVQKSFAHKLKEIACILFGCKVEDFESEEFKSSELPKEWGTSIGIHTYREFLQIVGTNLLREQFHPNVWINTLFSDYKQVVLGEDIEDGIRYKVKGDYPKWLITDVRFTNEADRIVKDNGILIKVVRDINNKDTHPSEIDLDDYDKFNYTISNDGTLEELIVKVREIMIDLGIIKL